MALKAWLEEHTERVLDVHTPFSQEYIEVLRCRFLYCWDLALAEPEDEEMHLLEALSAQEQALKIARAIYSDTHHEAILAFFRAQMLRLRIRGQQPPNSDIANYPRLKITHPDIFRLLIPVYQFFGEF